MKISSFHIEKMDCPVEEKLIRNRLSGMDGIDLLEFNLMSRVLTVTHRLANESDITVAIGSLGMDAVSRSDQIARIELPVARPSIWRTPGTMLTIASGVLAIAAELLDLTGVAGSVPIRILAGLAIILGGYQTATRAWMAVKTFTLNINFLMTIAVVGALVLG
ncbi:MAG: cation-transporting P-type ATPase, partial [Candidatus Kapaibacterium sp.]